MKIAEVRQSKEYEKCVNKIKKYKKVFSLLYMQKEFLNHNGMH